MIFWQESKQDSAAWPSAAGRKGRDSELLGRNKLSFLLICLLLLQCNSVTLVLVLCLCAHVHACVCVCVLVCFNGRGLPASVCFLEYTLYLWPDWTPGYKHKKRKKNHCCTASGEINLKANKRRKLILIVSFFFTRQSNSRLFYIIARLVWWFYFRPLKYTFLSIVLLQGRKFCSCVRVINGILIDPQWFNNESMWLYNLCLPITGGVWRNVLPCSQSVSSSWWCGVWLWWLLCKHRWVLPS